MNSGRQIHRRKSYRLKGFDYSQASLYFITICCKDKDCHFGKIEDGKILLNDVGNIANEYWLEIPKHYSRAILHEHIIMPNHMHGIIELRDAIINNVTTPVGTSPGMSLQNQFSKPIGGSISMIINQYKSSVKRWCNKNGFENFQWQSRFHDHIIRDDKSFRKISNYIATNPVKWLGDKFHSQPNNFPNISPNAV